MPHPSARTRARANPSHARPLRVVRTNEFRPRPDEPGPATTLHVRTNEPAPCTPEPDRGTPAPDRPLPSRTNPPTRRDQSNPTAQSHENTRTISPPRTSEPEPPGPCRPRCARALSSRGPCSTIPDSARRPLPSRQRRPRPRRRSMAPRSASPPTARRPPRSPGHAHVRTRATRPLGTVLHRRWPLVHARTRPATRCTGPPSMATNARAFSR